MLDKTEFFENTSLMHGEEFMRLDDGRFRQYADFEVVIFQRNRIRIRKTIACDDAHNNILKLPIIRIIRDDQDWTLLGCAEV